MYRLESRLLRTIVAYSEVLLDEYKDHIPDMVSLCRRAINNRPYKKFLHSRDIILQFVISTGFLGAKITAFPSDLYVIDYIDTLNRVFKFDIRIPHIQWVKYLRLALEYGLSWKAIIRSIILTKQAIPIDILLSQPVCYCVNERSIKYINIDMKTEHVNTILSSIAPCNRYLRRLSYIFACIKFHFPSTYKSICSLFHDTHKLFDTGNDAYTILASTFSLYM